MDLVLALGWVDRFLLGEGVVASELKYLLLAMSGRVREVSPWETGIMILTAIEMRFLIRRVTAITGFSHDVDLFLGGFSRRYGLLSSHQRAQHSTASSRTDSYA